MASIDAFLKLDSIKGESLDKDYKEQIEVISWGWGMTNSSSATFGTGSGTGKVHIGELVIVKRTDSSTASLITSVTTGKHIKEGTLVLRKATGKDPMVYYKIEMNELWVTGIEQGDLHAPEDAQVLTETVKFTFVSFKATYIQQKEDGSAGTTFPVEYNVKTNTAKHS